MAIINSSTVVIALNGGDLDIKHLFTASDGQTISIFKRVPGNWTEVEFSSDRSTLISSVEDDLATDEVIKAYIDAEMLQTVDRVAQHQPQADFDRRLLGRLMVESDVHVLLNAYPFFQAVSSRGGANRNQRAAYLSIPLAEWDQIDGRFNDVNGIAFFINDDKGQRWRKLPDGYR